MKVNRVDLCCLLLLTRDGNFLLGMKVTLHSLSK